MAKTALQLIADTVAKKHKITVKEAEKFVSAMFDVMNEGLKTDKLVKVKGLGTFKVQAVKPRESVNVNTGERVLIEGHDKVSFTPDATMKELVNKPFAQFETVVLNDGVDFTDIDSKYENEATLENADETTVSTNNAAIPETKVVSSNEEETTDSTNETANGAQETTIEQYTSTVKDSVETVSEPEKDHEIVVAKQEVAIETEAEPIKNTSETTEEEPIPLVETQPENIAEEPTVTAEMPVATEQKLEDANQTQPENIAEEPIATPETPVATEQKLESANQTQPENIVKEPIATPETPVTTEQKQEETAEKPKKINWLMWSAIGFFVIAIMYFFGYKFGKDAALRDNAVAVSAQPKSKPTAKAKQTKQHSSAKVAQTTTKQIQPTPKQVQSPIDDTEKFKQLSNDKRIRYGAYDIIGIEKVVVLKKGQTMQSYSRKALGPDMVAYFQVLNNATTMAAGDTMKVPKVELRPQYRSK
ncbi:MAG: HU family DNA-binding protein [Prevotella pallens]|jgi:DNA-binding protein HU|uniref:HU family DNA-binding protein n=1 Tax=Prevotella pallens TaxID=60133 RepID=UPI001CB0388E|nr:HU family DNA-binding protein [Prevotella pallens]MBF1442483.1 HU family DNA-binding protein [Prevotella pallens]MBF1488987.1 HU family DNA-binding protein [Prevotella pallens]